MSLDTLKTKAKGTATVIGEVYEKWQGLIFVREIHEVFDVITSEALNFSSDITEHYVEDNTAVSDNIARKPVTITLRGFVGEKVFKRTLIDVLRTMVYSNMAPVTSLVPQLSSVTQLAANALQHLEATLDRLSRNPLIRGLDRIASKDPLGDPGHRQQMALSTLNLWWKMNMNLTVTTTWGGEYKDMFIQDVRVEQTDSNQMSEITVELKQIKFVETKTTSINYQQYADRCAKQREEEENLGKLNGQRRSILAALVGKTK